MTSDEFTKYELDGRNFAKTLLDAGFDKQRVEDAATVPAMRLWKKESLDRRIFVQELLAQLTKSSSECRKAAKDFDIVSAAFWAGVMSEIEARR